MATASLSDRLLDRLYLERLKRRVPGLVIKNGAYINRTVRIDIAGPEDRIELDQAILRHGVFLSTFGNYARFAPGASIGPYCVLYAQGGLDIGRNVSIGPGCVISSGGHRFDGPGPIREQGVTKAPVWIADDSWIGAHATILEGVTIGEGAIVAAGAVVTKSVPPGGLVAGVPATRIRLRDGAA